MQDRKSDPLHGETTPAEREDDDGAIRAALSASFLSRWWRRLVDAGPAGPDPDGLARDGLARDGLGRDLGAAAMAATGARAPTRVAALLGCTRAEAASLVREFAAIDPNQVRADAQAAGADVVTWRRSSYADGWRDLADPPPAYFQRGARRFDDQPIVGLVGEPLAGFDPSLVAGPAPGSRGALVAALCRDLTTAGVAVAATVEMQLGCGVRAALEAQGEVHLFCRGGIAWTEASLGFGAGANTNQATSGAKSGNRTDGAGPAVWISEAAPRSPPGERSTVVGRLMAAWSSALVVLGPGPTARAAIDAAVDLGRPLLVVPDRIETMTGRMAVELIRDGALPVGSVLDIFSALGLVGRTSTTLSRIERRCLDALGDDGARLEEVARRVGLSAQSAASYLIALLARGYVRRFDERFFEERAPP